MHTEPPFMAKKEAEINEPTPVDKISAVANGILLRYGQLAQRHRELSRELASVESGMNVLEEQLNGLGKAAEVVGGKPCPVTPA